MSKLIKLIDNDTIEISDYRCSAVLYPEPLTLQKIKDQMDHCEDWCVFKRTINPFQMYAENEELQDRIDKAIEYIENNVAVYAFNNKDFPHWEFNDENIEELLSILKGDDNEND